MPATVEHPEYVLPNNAAESDRLDFQHILLTRTFEGLHRAPLDTSKPLRVLDIGCGTGNWAIDFAKQSPQSQVIAFDVQEKGDWATAPSNCTFKVADLETDETWSSLGDFDFIHGRFIVIGVRDWHALLKRCHAHLLPGGFVEVQEFCMPCKSLDSKDEETSKFIAWSNSMVSVGNQIKLKLQIMNDMPDLMKAAGIQGVDLKEFRMLTGPWMEDEEGKVLGRMGQQNLVQGMYGFGETLHTKILGWSGEKYQGWVDGIRKEMLEDGLRTWLPVKGMSKWTYEGREETYAPQYLPICLIRKS
ncbi:hypothetical protein PRZ48_000521 [Zasmidium cellare]|uniref:S-adenosyl-L-methionine-dependent methyltransferase n=1 Tax=Zasmidium cellare TaxID=395010 RepID=A0ABR0F0C4_ZASCE|nr:hypothetical protein PRZ48_000521 [Zasmidium cellare]